MMNIKNFELIAVEGTGPIDWFFRGSVEVTTGFLFWRKTTRRPVSRSYIGYWRFEDTGKFTPDDVSHAVYVWKCQNAKTEAQQQL